MRYRTVEKSEQVHLYRERRSPSQNNNFPIEDLNGNTIAKERRVTHNNGAEGFEVTESNITQTEFDRTLLTENHLISVITSIEKHGYDLDDFKFYTQRTRSYKLGILDPKAVVYAYRISVGIEISYIVGDDPDFSKAFADDLKAGFFER